MSPTAAIAAFVNAPEASIAPKAFLRGAHRTRTPEALLAEIEGDLTKFGATRAARLTGLDRIGIEVYGVARPNARGLSVAQGKGATGAAAKVSGVMEAIELWHAERPTLPLRMASAREIDADPMWPIATDAPTLWADAVDLFDGGVRPVPFDLVHCCFLADLRRDLEVSTNGLASGAVLAEALLHGLAELVERHGVARLAEMPLEERDRRDIDLYSVTDAAAARMIEQIREAGCRVRLWNATSDIETPCCVAAIADLQDPETPPGFGAGAHTSPGVAVARAISEAAQSRLARISGARDDLDRGDFGPLAAARAQWLTAPHAGARQEFGDLPDIATDDVADDFRRLLEAMRLAGYKRIFATELSDDPRFSVVRVLAPELAGYGSGH